MTYKYLKNAHVLVKLLSAKNEISQPQMLDNT